MIGSVRINTDKFRKTAAGYGIARQEIDDVVAAAGALTFPKKIGDFAAWNSSISKIKSLVVLVAALFENLPGATSQKKSEAAADCLDQLIELPFIIELFDDTIFQIAINFVVDELNKWLGKDWRKVRARILSGVSIDAIAKDKDSLSGPAN